jgi:hypothetical protein
MIGLTKKSGSLNPCSWPSALPLTMPPVKLDLESRDFFLGESPIPWYYAPWLGETCPMGSPAAGCHASAFTRMGAEACL